METIRVLLVEDHPSFRRALLSLFELEPDLEVVGVVERGQDALECVCRIRPEVVCIDLYLPGGMNGAEITRQLADRLPGTRVIGLSAHTDVDSAAQFLQSGAMGYVDKLSVAAELPAAIRAAHAGRVYVCSEARRVYEEGSAGAR